MCESHMPFDMNRLNIGIKTAIASFNLIILTIFFMLFFTVSNKFNVKIGDEIFKCNLFKLIKFMKTNGANAANNCVLFSNLRNRTCLSMSSNSWTNAATFISTTQISQNNCRFNYSQWAHSDYMHLNLNIFRIYGMRSISYRHWSLIFHWYWSTLRV